ncbi:MULTISPECIES: O-linked N-acetylglucosamine transferase, SPINDLY family protein [unclassified Leptolyngbya]|uniref:O-linked N-acetylglucosamine transferase, SPINDLY family protein n=1 Tax=unclassified Leptolyngbya TaxID=2650499 RepID=UPI0016898159|nr:MULTISPECIES: O-linked N-acetylglucosamine transferase, SPINDLY family protein [unclassified Leptolyngbya]MBD1913923.1 O-linked N-acetylglucosamine transferase, SPINDLY family protein [Leptolyngbya sp. FACHB-8]MBD2156375.1 O-linked N-acetylglucosamine transferase, SPINDLY family protein [Leptolyngbya sp. FACHB-16]
MPSSNIVSLDELQRASQQALQTDNFEEAITYLEQIIEKQPQAIQYRLPLGLAYLLIGQEEAAQLTWAIAFSEVDEADGEFLLGELVQLLQAKIEAYERQEKWGLADLLYQHLHQLTPTDTNSILKGIQTALKGELLSRERLENTGLLETLETTIQQPEAIDLELLDATLQEVIIRDDGNRDLLSWIEETARYLPNPEAVTHKLYEKSIQVRMRSPYNSNSSKALAYIDAALRLDGTNFGLKHERVFIFIKSARYQEAATMAEALLMDCENKQEKVFAKCLLLDALIHLSDRWNDSQSHLEDILQLLRELIQEYSENPGLYMPSALATRSLFFYQYIKDNPVEYRSLQNQLAQIYVDSIQKQHEEKAVISDRVQVLGTSRKLRIGFLSECMTKHSVGWLSRWIFQHYDRERFEFYCYFKIYTTRPEGLDDFSQEWFADLSTGACIVYGDPEEIAKIIKQDDIDILVDLDSVTSEKNYATFALKPARIQVTWLGYDATGLPTVDYFLADRFVLPDHADDYYTETIWRMPTTYIAVDGFEVSVPSLRRDKLDIPADAVVYFSAQTAAKRHPDAVRCQIEILKQVPNSYLLLKGKGDADALRNSFLQTAEEEGIAGDRFRFLPPVKHESTHRANLSIADVVLDTFPYTGATTTLETLWMGIPLVTLVGNQFTSRNSYAMLRHAGIEAGIAYSQEEYIEWGVRLGSDAALREQVKRQLWRSRQTSPLWNAKQFTRDLENAFEQMWQQYLETSSQSN